MKSNHSIQFVAFVLIAILSVSTPVCFASGKQNTKEIQTDLSQPSQSFYSAPVERLGSGFSNIVYGPLELIYQFKEEIKRTDPIRGTVPGVIRGVSWFAAREVVGVFELVTFFLPLKPHLEPFNTDWLHI